MAGLRTSYNSAAIVRFLAIVVGCTTILTLLYRLNCVQIVTMTQTFGSAPERKTIQNQTMITEEDGGTTNSHDNSMYSCSPLSTCAKLKKFFNENWNSTKPKAAVYILSRASDANDLKRTLKELETNFLSKFSYPVIIFYEKDFVPHIPAIKSLTKLNIFFQEVKFEVPKYIFPPANEIFECAITNIGYRHMCRFHSKTVYELPLMRQLEYYLRLDAHSYITKPVPYDLFKNMKDEGLLYLYPCSDWDTASCVSYLWEAVQTFIALKRIKPHFFSEMTGRKIFYNNFEMARMNVFTATSYQNYINYIDQLGGIYHNRWGDAPIKSLGVSIFVPRNKVKRISDITYYHRGVLHDKEDCFNKLAEHKKTK